MKWQQVAANWPAFVEVISNRWPRTDENDLLAIAGNRERFEEYLSKAHDLTRAEAQDEVESWLMGSRPAEVVMAADRGGANLSSGGRSLHNGEDFYAKDRDLHDWSDKA